MSTRGVKRSHPIAKIAMLANYAEGRELLLTWVTSREAVLLCWQ